MAWQKDVRLGAAGEDQFSEIARSHFTPVAGAMRFPAPDIEGMRHALLPERLAQTPVTAAKGIVLADRQRDLEIPQSAENVRIRQVGNEVIGRVEVDVVVVMAVEQTGKASHRLRQIVSAAEPDHSLKQPWIAQRNIDGVPGADAATVSRQIRIGIDIRGERNDLIQNVLLIFTMTRNAFSGRFSPGV